ncbi:HET-domain-containing protein [Dendrothele bispora CBS 962.96]|uniref:HET-domain-containing protein n=1 Tax=Dendrothele bispora (strain CBS 962.96) TaxID=1314807 RepID=A0A4S8LJ92_DENBC|nr:HET-domain-containing protein [Dendrothele bispora CBS 962.96]
MTAPLPEQPRHLPLSSSRTSLPTMTASLHTQPLPLPLSSSKTSQSTRTAPLRTRPTHLPLSSSRTAPLRTQPQCPPLFCQFTRTAPLRIRPRRLIETYTGRIVEFHENSLIPPYAVLSHRWEEDQEVSLQDMLYLSPAITERRSGYWKIVNACRQAFWDGFSYIWVDTCCIDKSIPWQEEQDINSMYAYYWNSEVCYVYLNDFRISGDPAYDKYCGFGKSTWFTRGWTLQELLAPSSVRFFTVDWEFYGDKKYLGDIIELATNIPRKFFDRENIRGAELREKMSWSVFRGTTKPEDRAYCLLGILGVTTKTEYGEGVFRAFDRLHDVLRIRYPDTKGIDPLLVSRSCSVLFEIYKHSNQKSLAIYLDHLPSSSSFTSTLIGE